MRNWKAMKTRNYKPSLASKKECTGCMACRDACLHEALTMRRYDDGHWYPSVDSLACVGCDRRSDFTIGDFWGHPSGLRKKFIVVPPSKGHELRFVSMLQQLGIGERYVESFEDFQSRRSSLYKDIDYASVAPKLATLRNESLDFLRSNL